VIVAVTNMNASDIQAKNIVCGLDLRAERRYVRADPARLQQVLWNVLKNAAKFTTDGGNIRVETKNDREGFVVTKITDSGMGMSRELIDRLFVPFEQGDDANVRRAGGLGLGMAIAKSLVDLQGGTITAQSEGPGRGSTFTVSFPSVETPVQHSELKPMSNAPTATPAEVQPLRILIVEDHQDTATVMSRLLTRLGHSVQATDTVASAVDMVRGGSFDVILSDIGLPDGSGVDFIKQVRVFSPVPAVALSGFGMDDDVAQAEAAGFNAHVTKPVNFNKLQSVLREVTTKKV
jgi:CheY-like chemotaxis protein